MMVRFRTPTVIALVGALAACKPAAPVATSNDDEVTVSASPLRPVAAGDPVTPGSWALLVSDQGTGLAFPSTGTKRVIHLYCAARSPELLVNLPQVRPVASEERLSFGGGGEVVGLVADVRGDRLRGGVSGSGAAPATLDAMLRAGPGASYGASALGPLPPVPAEDAHRFAAACHPKAALPPPTSPCREQDGKPIAGPALRATGTEPFWGADIDGRCVTYSTPETQAGVRLWTRFRRSGGSASYAGALGGQPFRMDIRTEADCSDGMSDRRYPLAVTLRIGGDTRRGCAAPR